MINKGRWEYAKSVLIVQYSSNRDGSAVSGLLSANALLEAGWITHVVFGFHGPMVEQYRDAGHATHVLAHKNWLRRGILHQFAKDVVMEWRRAPEFGRLMSEVAPSLVYVNTVVSLGAARAASRLQIPCLWHLREMFADTGGEMHCPRFAKPFVRSVIRRSATLLVANSRATKEDLLGSDAGVAVIPNAVEDAFFNDQRDCIEARAALGLREDGLLIAVPGTLRPMKGHDFFFRSVAGMLKSHDQCDIVVSGGVENDYARSITAMVERLGCADRTQFLGWVDDMSAFYRACDVVCIPSRMEPFGRTVIEAFASGTPVVATSVGGIKETIEPGKTGLLVSYGDEEGLAAALRQLLDDSDHRQRLSRNARKVALKQYDQRTYKQRISEAAAQAAGTRSA